ncbi:DUF4224 domain-containing protein [Roseateles sp. BYS96W]|uniref:DUF4224 domain-containing protein n=1 Tax=Pelomonas nitida TaxID=3299027 RepID=A0ABW7G7K5_9BURK
MTVDAPPRTDLMLSTDELREITGYIKPARQVEELRRQGFWRARRNAAGAVVLERRHYDAVCAGAGAPAPDDGPRLRTPVLRRSS